MTKPPADLGGTLNDAPVRYHPALAPLLRPIDQVRQHPDNPRKGNLEAIATSIANHGVYRPITIQTSTGYVLLGNNTLRVLTDAGATHVPAVEADVDDEEAKRILADDNRTSDLAAYDERALADLLDGMDLSGSVWTDDDRDDLLAALDEAAAAQAAAAANDPSGSGATGERDGAWESPSLADYAARYDEQGRRLVVLDYDKPGYAEVTARLDVLRDKHGVDNNAEAVRAELAALYPDVHPPSPDEATGEPAAEPEAVTA